MTWPPDHYAKYVSLRLVDDHLRLGWLPTTIDGGLHGTGHAEWSIIMVAVCPCPFQYRRFPHCIATSR